MSKSANKAITSVVLACIVAACLALVGCGSSGTSSSAGDGSSADSASGEAVADKEFGSKTPTAKDIVFTNETGGTINGLTAVPVEAQQDASLKLMAATDTWASDEVATVYIDPTGTELFNLSFSINGTQYQLHNVDFAQLKNASIRIEGGLAYLTTELNGAAVSTLQDEYNIANPAPVQEDEPEEEYYDNDNDDNVDYDYDYDDEYYDEDVDQSEDACVDDVVLN